jgi:hypothetical protein
MPRRPAPLAFALALGALVATGDAGARGASERGAGRGAGDAAGTVGEALAPLPVPDEAAPDADADADDEPELEPEEEGPAAPRGGKGALPVASRYAALGRARCESELKKRKIRFVRVAEARGVVSPVRLAGPLSGVTFRSMLPLKQRRTSPYEIYDCRLVLALDDFAKILARHDITEVVHYSVYRPPRKKKKLRGPGRRHTGGLAIDAAVFKTKDGRAMSVLKDFDGRRGRKPCGPGAKPSPTELRTIVCEAADAELFNVLLTPNYNRAHRNHFHLEVTPGVRWVHVR